MPSAGDDGGAGVVVVRLAFGLASGDTLSFRRQSGLDDGALLGDA